LEEKARFVFAPIHHVRKDTHSASEKASLDATCGGVRADIADTSLLVRRELKAKDQVAFHGLF
jgi:predicted class III extradiol MEMO1 family dioxygenase